MLNVIVTKVKAPTMKTFKKYDFGKAAFDVFGLTNVDWITGRERWNELAPTSESLSDTSF
jgi:hypothetical protein